MKNDIRSSGIGIVGNIPWGTHFSQFYQTKEELIEVLIPYFKAGLENKELCIWITSQSFELEDAKRSLEENVPYFDAYLKREQMNIIPYSNWFLKEGIFNLERVLTEYLKTLNEALANGYNGLRLVEDTSWVGKEFWNYFVDYEEKLDSLINSHQIIVLHPYCLDIANGAETTDLISSHQMSLIKKKGKWQFIERPMQKNGPDCKLAEEALDEIHEKIRSQSEELQKANKKLRESEERLQIIVTNSPDIIFEQDCNLRYTWIYNLMSPLTPSDVIGKTDADIFPPDQAQLLTSIKHRVLKTGIREEVILQLSLGGKSQWYEAIYEPRFNEAREVIGLVSYSRDITRRKKIEDALRKSEERYRMLFTNMTEGFVLGEVIFNENSKPSDYRYLEVNPAFEIQAGVKKEKLLGKSISEIFPNPDPVQFKKLEKVVLSGQSTHLDYFSQELGKYFEIYIFSPEKGKIAAIFRDVTERKQVEKALQKSEERYRMLFTNMIEGFGLVDVIYNEDGEPSDYRYLEINPIFELFLGKKREQLIGKTMRETFPNVSLLAIEKYNEVALSGQPINFEIFSKVAKRYLDINAFIPEKGKVAIILRDITERKKAQAALQASEEQYRAFFENSMDAVLLILPDGNISAANQAAQQIFGMTEEEITQAGRNGIADLSDPRLKPAIEERARTGKFKGELNYRRKDGTIFTGEASSAFFKDKNGLVKTAMIVRDITERKRAEEELRKSENRFRVMFEEHGAPMLLIEPNSGQIIDANEAAARFYEYSREQLRTMYIDQINQLPPEEVAAERYNVIDRSKNVFVFMHRLASGDERLVEVYSSPVTIEGRPILFSIIHDITLRKKAEEALKEAHDTLEAKIKERTKELEEAYNSLKESKERLAEAQKMAHIGNWEWDLASDKFDLSDELYRIFGLDPKEVEPSYNKFLSYVHPDDLDYVVSIIYQAQNGKPYSTEYRIIWSNGEERTVHMESEVIFDEKNKPTRIKGIIQDITERKQAEDASEKIEIARKKEIHHRIKNNLQVISSLLDLQAEHFRNKECIQDSEVLEAFRESQDRVISMALIHEELYRGGGFETLNFSPYIQELAENLFQTYRLGDTDISLKLDLAENAFFDMDIAVPLGMIVNELVSNSLKHAFIGRDEGEIRIELFREESTGLKCKDCESTSFVLTIYDNGMGIPELEIEDLDSLGMQLVTSLVNQLDGEFELKRDNGTEFIIRFKVKER